MKNLRPLLFVIFGIATAIALTRVELNQERLALSRWSEIVSKDPSLRQIVESHCSVIVGEEQSDAEATFLRAVSLSKQAPGIKRCELKVASRSQTRFFVLSHWAFSVSLESSEHAFEFQRTFLVRFPLLLALLPLVLWALALLFNTRGFSFLSSIGLMLFLSCGLNPREVSRVAWESVGHLMLAEKNFIPLCALLFWAVLLKNSKTPQNYVWPKNIGRLLGIWNPASLGGLFPLQYPKTHLFGSLWDQAVCACASAYFLVPQWDRWQEVLENLTAPRYFTAAVAVLIGVRWYRQELPSVSANRTLVLRSFMAVVILEALGFFIPYIKQIDIFLRMTLTLNAAVLLTPKLFEWNKVFRDLTGLRWLCLGLFIGAFNLTSGTTALVLEWFAPQYHPNGIVHSTFLSGLMTGVISGNFSYSYFSLAPLISKYQSVPLVKAALVDGVTAGTLLSPFHPLALMSAGFFKTTFQDAFIDRAKLFLPPILVALFIYTLGALQLFSVLLPITFLFLCLAISAYALKSNRWSFS